MRSDIINRIIQIFKYTTYLELGVDNRSLNFEKINCVNKFCVDINPRSRPDFTGSTDDFFSQNTKKFELVFIDADHSHEQVIKDIENSLSALAPNGTIVCHDMNPTTKEMQVVPRQQGIWTGDAWRAWLKFREREDLSMCVIDADYGCGIIRRGSQSPIKVDNPTYEQFTENKKEWLNLIAGDLSPMSIIIPAFEQYGHGGRTLNLLLQSIINLRGKFEVVVSDNSQDNSIEGVCNLYKKKFDITHFKNPVRGISENTNAALDAAKYELNKIMYQDDIFLARDAIEHTAFALKLSHWVGLEGTAINKNGKALRKTSPRFSPEMITTGKNSFGMPSVCAFRKNGIRFDTSLKTMLDCDFYYQMYKQYGEPGIIRGNYIGSRYWDGSTSRRQGSFLQAELPYLNRKYAGA